jgi:hypothetical protein
MRYHLPPPDEEPRPRAVRGVAALGTAPGATPRDPDVGPGPEGRLVRTVALAPGEAGPYLRRWESEVPGTRALPAPDGIAARERTRPDRSVPGALRRQRLAVRPAAGGATAVHWSAPEPVLPDDEAAWRRALDRLLGAGRAAPRGWAA